MKTHALPSILTAALLAVTLSATSAFAASGIFESYAILKLNGGSNAYYDMQATTGNPDFQGAALGTYDNVANPNSLILNGGEIKTFKNGLSDVTGGTFNYRVFKVGDAPGSFSNFALNFAANLGGGDQKWDNTAANKNLLTGLSSGNYTVEVYAEAATSDGTAFSNNSGANYKASFTVVPEPASAMLLLTGMSALLLRRRRA